MLKGGFMRINKHYKGNRIRASDRSLVVRSMGGRLACLFLLVVLLLNINTLLHTDWNTLSLFQNSSIKLTVTTYMIVSFIVAGTGVRLGCVPVRPLPAGQDKAALSPPKAVTDDIGKWLV